MQTAGQARSQVMRELFSAPQLQHPPKGVQPVRADGEGRPGRSGASRPHSPLGTVRDSFPSYGSSISKGSPCGAARLCCLLSRNHGLIFPGGHGRQQLAFLLIPTAPEVAGVFGQVRISIRFDLHISPKSP